MFGVDWSAKKEFKIYNMEQKKVKSMAPTEENFEEFFTKLTEKSKFFIEEGGGDTFKLLALKYGHMVFTMPGKVVKDYREKLNKSKTDEGDAVLIAELASQRPELFHQYSEDDTLTLRIGILYKEYSKRLEDQVREKNQLHALKRKFSLLMSTSTIDKIIKHRETAIAAYVEETNTIRKELRHLVDNHPLWIDYLVDVKSVGPVIAAGIIGSVRRFSRFPNKYSLRHFAGMITKKGNHEYNRQLKLALYSFIEGVIKLRAQPWRKLYDNMKKYYTKKHKDWSKGKVDNFAKKFVQTKFLDKVYKAGRKIEAGSPLRSKQQKKVIVKISKLKAELAKLN